MTTSGSAPVDRRHQLVEVGAQRRHLDVGLGRQQRGDPLADEQASPRPPSPGCSLPGSYCVAPGRPLTPRSFGAQALPRGAGGPEAGNQAHGVAEHDHGSVTATRAGTDTSGSAIVPRRSASSVQVQRPTITPTGIPTMTATDAHGGRLPQHGAHHLAGGEAEGAQHGQVVAPATHRHHQRVGHRRGQQHRHQGGQQGGGGPEPLDADHAGRAVGRVDGERQLPSGPCAGRRPDSVVNDRPGAQRKRYSVFWKSELKCCQPALGQQGSHPEAGLVRAGVGGQAGQDGAADHPYLLPPVPAPPTDSRTVAADVGVEAVHRGLPEGHLVGRAPAADPGRRWAARRVTGTSPRAGMASAPERTSPTSSRDEAATDPERSATSTNSFWAARAWAGSLPLQPLELLRSSRLDLAVPGRAVEPRVAEQVVEAGGEHGHRGDEGDRGGGGQQRGAHRHRRAARPRVRARSGRRSPRRAIRRRRRRRPPPAIGSSPARRRRSAMPARRGRP